MTLPLSPTWTDIAIRLALSVLAGAVVGLNRGARGHAAGFRTTILVTLAASVAMIQANILLTVNGKTPGSFAVMDIMRLPLGILTGVGFIGAGTIVRKGDLITGVTTARRPSISSSRCMVGTKSNRSSSRLIMRDRRVDEGDCSMLPAAFRFPSENHFLTCE